MPKPDGIIKTVQGSEVKMAQKNKVMMSVRIDEDLYRKMLAVAKAEGRDENNHMLHLIRTNVAYYERIHGKINTSDIVIPESTETEK